MTICWTSDRLFSFYDGIELNHNTRFTSTCVDVVASFLVVLDFVAQCNYKFVYEINRAILEISDLNNFINTSVLCWWAEWRQDTIVSVKIRSWKSEIVFRNCFSDWYFCFNKPFIPKVSELFFLLLPKLEIFLTDLSISSSKAIVLLVAAVK